MEKLLEFEGKFVALVQMPENKGPALGETGRRLDDLYGKGFRIIDVTPQGVVILENELRLEDEEE